MCGICGLVHAIPDYPIDESVLLRMRDSLIHRGPDDAGYYLSGGVGLGSRSLTVNKLHERDIMPMSTPDGRYWIVYDGQIYNVKELRATLQHQGVTFHTQADTEVLLRLFIREGPAMLEKLNGMFAFAVWDVQERTLFLTRDRLGIKPCYYILQDRVFYFASELKAFMVAGLPISFNSATWEELLCFRYVAGEETPYTSIKRLLPGHFLIWKDGYFYTKRWWNLSEKAAIIQSSLESDLVSYWRRLFDSAVDYTRISDVPLGVLLSGGLDSGSVAASLASQKASEVTSFNMRFDSPEYDEGLFVKEVAQYWDFQNHSLRVKPQDLLPLLEEVSFYNDEPLEQGNEPYFYTIARYAKPLVTVLFSGEGADETLAGYVRYQPLRYAILFPYLKRLTSLLRLPGSGHRLRKLATFLDLGSVDKFILYNVCNTLPNQLSVLGFQPKEQYPYRQSILEEAKHYSNNPVRQAMYVDQHTFLNSTLDPLDHMSMAASIECRLPFLDHRLVELASAVPTHELFGQGQGKWLARRAMQHSLPPAIIQHKKWGFGVPWNVIIRNYPDIRQVMIELPELEPLLSGPFDRRKLHNLIIEFLNGSDEYYPLLLQFLMIAIWYKQTFRITRTDHR
jgi:asparagine synthase (glutamine-hydrolysing)